VGATEPSKSDIKEYQVTLQEASTAIATLHELVKRIDQIGVENKLPAITKAIVKIGQQGKEWFLQAFMLCVVLILILLIGAVFAMLFFDT
jgi:hypothetical protein